MKPPKRKPIGRKDHHLFIRRTRGPGDTERRDWIVCGDHERPPGVVIFVANPDGASHLSGVLGCDRDGRAVNFQTGFPGGGYNIAAEPLPVNGAIPHHGDAAHAFVAHVGGERLRLHQVVGHDADDGADSRGCDCRWRCRQAVVATGQVHCCCCHAHMKQAGAVENRSHLPHAI